MNASGSPVEPGCGRKYSGTPAGGRGLQGLDLPADGPVRGPALLHQGGGGVVPGEPDRGQVQVQPGGIGDGEPAHRGQQQPAAHGLRGRGQRLQRPAQPVIVQQRRRDAQQLGDRRRGRPPGDVIQRRRGAQPARGQHRDHLPVPGQGPAPPRQHPVHDPGHAQGPQVVRHDQQRARHAGGCRAAAGAAGPARRPAAPAARRPPAHPAGPGLPQRAGAPGRPRAGPRPAPGTA